jgi:glyoxylase-like metal-dependent hydrolase (beta-lactamase superfamily II)
MKLPHWKKVLWIGLLTVLIVFSGLFYLLFLYRTGLPGAPAPQRAAPRLESLPAVQACWVESASVLSGTALGATVSGLLIRHPTADVLVDAGNSSRFDEEISGHPWAVRFRLQVLLGALKARTPLGELLKRLNVDTRRLMFIASHAHLDHIGGLMDLPPVPVLMAKEERAYLADRAAWEIGYVMPAQAVVLLDGRIVPVEFTAQRYEIFERSYDVFRDGSVVIVPLFGHTPGSVGVFVNLSAEKRLLHIGDATDDVKGYQDNVGKTLALRATDKDRARADAVVTQLHHLHRQQPALHILPAHGRPAWERAFPQGPMSCVEK